MLFVVNFPGNIILQSIGLLDYSIPYRIDSFAIRITSACAIELDRWRRAVPLSAAPSIYVLPAYFA